MAFAGRGHTCWEHSEGPSRWIEDFSGIVGPARSRVRFATRDQNLAVLQ